MALEAAAGVPGRATLQRPEHTSSQHQVSQIGKQREPGAPHPAGPSPPRRCGRSQSAGMERLEQMERSELGRGQSSGELRWTGIQAGQEGAGGAPSLSNRLPVALLRSAGGWDGPTHLPGSNPWDKNDHSQKSGPPHPHPTSTSEGRRGLRGNHRQGGKGPGLPTLTPAVPCSRRDSCNPLCRGETEASLLSQDSCLS